MNDGHAWRALHAYLGAEDQFDRFLRDVVADLDASAHRWFFIRYGAGGPHLRIRVRCTAVGFAMLTEACRRRASALVETAVDRQWLEQVQFPGAEGRPPGLVEEQPYEPETERYGGAAALSISETLFALSSRLAVGVIARPGTDPSFLARQALDLMIAVVAVLYQDAEQARRYFTRYARGWRSYFGERGRPLPTLVPIAPVPAATLQARMDALRRDRGGRSPTQAWHDAVRSTHAALSVLAAEGRLFSPPDGRTLDAAADPSRALANILGSQMHMMANRLGFSPLDEIRWCDAIAMDSVVAVTTAGHRSQGGAVTMGHVLTKRELLQSLSTVEPLDEAPRRSGMLRIVGAGIVGAVVSAGIVLAVDRNAPASADPPVTGTVPAASRAEQTADRMVANGYVVARHQATVAAEVTGRLVADHISEGEFVHRGQLLAVLDNSVAQADLSAQASLNRASTAAIGAVAAQLTEARVAALRTADLSRRGFATRAQLSSDQAHVSQLTANLEQAMSQNAANQHNRERAAAALAKYAIRAPFSGIVINKAAQAGEIISPVSAGGGFTRTGLCTIVDMTSLEIVVDVDEDMIARVGPGQRVTATLAAYPDVRFPASVVALIPTVDRTKATIPVRIRFDRLDPRMLPDMAVTVSFPRRGETIEGQR